MSLTTFAKVEKQIKMAAKANKILIVMFWQNDELGIFLAQFGKFAERYKYFAYFAFVDILLAKDVVDAYGYCRGGPSFQIWAGQGRVAILPADLSALYKKMAELYDKKKSGNYSGENGSGYEGDEDEQMPEYVADKKHGEVKTISSFIPGVVGDDFTSFAKNAD